jgi:transcriptional regulator with XRE-family HTH domain
VNAVENEIGARLKRLRRRCGLTGRELARRVGVAQSYVSKIENGRIHPHLDFCTKVARALRLDDDETQSLLSLLTLYQAEHHPLSRRQDALEERQDAILKLEHGATMIRVYQPMLIPGLLQTRKYMDALFSRYAGGTADLASAVHKRTERQSFMNDERRTFRVLFTENSLLTKICPKTAMIDQIRAIKRLAKRPNVMVGYLAGSTEMPAGMKIPMSGFEALDDTMVMVDTLVGFISFRHPDEVAEYLKVFELLESISLRGETMFREIDKCLKRRDRFRPPVSSRNSSNSSPLKPGDDSIAHLERR